MARFPLFFNHGGLVAGRGYVAHVQIGGRCVLDDDADGEVWFHGVNPGGLAEGGSTQGEASSAYLRAIQEVVIDLAEESPDFETFRAAVERFVLETNLPLERVWLGAVSDVRSGAVPRDGYRVVDAERAPTVRVDLIASNEPAAKPTAEPGPALNAENELLVACG